MINVDLLHAMAPELNHAIGRRSSGMAGSSRPIQVPNEWYSEELFGSDLSQVGKTAGAHSPHDWFTLTVVGTSNGPAGVGRFSLRPTMIGRSLVE